ncbi:related to Folylpolyglutamate synthase [Saccharomycodes ludwigii]|uniref:Related to Folylpolyglutamate synthase n=1 Tax=Saccharomycodes ludwigii TaxID=36035 RepID=A0A376BA28_9ASCO|nr:related to Folylpolyglutamate synthase [Saccharomycodes ludwigii]
MSIKLGLSRISQLLKISNVNTNKLKVIHVGGTNGKGSTCSYLTTMLIQAIKNYNSKNNMRDNNNGKIGKFTSPHLIHPSDCISINNKTIPMSHYQTYYKECATLNTNYGIKASNFEILTCIALKYFQDNKVDYCVIEVGVGGATDATNVIESKLCCIITKLSLDHQKLLGNTLVDIAKEKSGIIKKGVKHVIIDGTNDKEILQVFIDKCGKVGSSWELTDISKTIQFQEFTNRVLGYQRYNLLNALYAMRYLSSIDHANLLISDDDIFKCINETKWYGRLQKLSLKYDHKSNPIDVLIDGAHNKDGAKQLGEYLTQHVRPTLDSNKNGLIFVIAMTVGKDVDGLLRGLSISCNDKVIVTQFNAVQDMPWITSMDPDTLAQHILKKGFTNQVIVEPDLTQIFKNSVFSDGQISIKNNYDTHTNIVICGSLYLAGQILEQHLKNTR